MSGADRHQTSASSEPRGGVPRMPHTRRRLVGVLGIAIALLVGGAAVVQMTREDKVRPDPDEIVYVEATWLPDAWVVGHVTERQTDLDQPAPEYTIVWRPAARAGESRSDSVGNDEGPSMYAVVAAAWWNGLATYDELEEFDLASAEVTEEESGQFSLEFWLGCCRVHLGGSGVDAATLRRVAEGLQTVRRDEWVDGLGDRLV